MLLAEDLLLLLTDDATGRLVVSGAEADVVLAGAQLVDLTLAGRVDVDERKRLVVRDSSPTSDELLDRALASVQRREGKRVAAAMPELRRKVRPLVYDRLVAQGFLRAEDGTVLGVFPTHRWPAVATDHEAALRRGLVAVLVDGGPPDRRQGALLALLHGLRSTHKVVRPKDHGMTRRDLDRRAKEVAQGSWAGEEVRRSIDAMTTAVAVAVAVGAAGGDGG